MLEADSFDDDAAFADINPDCLCDPGPRACLSRACRSFSSFSDDWAMNEFDFEALDTAALGSQSQASVDEADISCAVDSSDAALRTSFIPASRVAMATETQAEPPRKCLFPGPQPPPSTPVALEKPSAFSATASPSTPTYIDTSNDVADAIALLAGGDDGWNDDGDDDLFTDCAALPVLQEECSVSNLSIDTRQYLPEPEIAACAESSDPGQMCGLSLPSSAFSSLMIQS